MPLLAGLAPLVVALMAALLAIACDLIVWAVASQLPNLSILGVGLNLARIFRDTAQGIINWCVGEMSQFFDALADWFTAHVIVHDQFFGAVVSAVGHLGDQIAHIVNHVVPNAISAAEADAGRVAHDLFHTAETDIGAVGDRVDTLVTRTIPNAIHTAETYADGAVSQLDRALTRAIADAKTAVEQDLQTAKTDLTRSISSLADTVARDYTDALRTAQADATAALNTARDLINTAKAEAENMAKADVNAARTALQAAIEATNDTVGRLTSTVASDLTAAEQYARNQVATGVQQVTDTLHGAIAGVEQDIAGALGTAEGAIAGALGDIYTDVTGQSLAYNGDLTKVAGAVGLAITGAIAGVVARVAHLEKCSVGVCEDSPNNFSNLLKDALGIGAVLGVGGFLKEAIDRPVEAEQKYAGVFATGVQDAQHAFDLLLSL
jgi:F0F1-type ATP synthase membrane subunit b/b'